MNNNGISIRRAAVSAAASHIFILSAPSGAGKTTLCEAVRRHFPDMAYSVSYTTRRPRAGEQDGKDYFFITPQEFEIGIHQDRWAEWAKVHGHYYGTCARWITDTLASGKDVLMDIDVQGTRQILKRFPEAVTIFILPPDMDALKQRLMRRGTNDEKDIAVRLANAQNEIAQKDLYRHLLINDRLENAAFRLINLMDSYRNASTLSGKEDA